MEGGNTAQTAAQKWTVKVMSKYRRGQSIRVKSIERLFKAVKKIIRQEAAKQKVEVAGNIYDNTNPLKGGVNDG